MSWSSLRSLNPFLQHWATDLYFAGSRSVHLIKPRALTRDYCRIFSTTHAPIQTDYRSHQMNVLISRLALLLLFTFICPFLNPQSMLCMMYPIWNSPNYAGEKQAELSYNVKRSDSCRCESQEAGVLQGHLQGVKGQSVRKRARFPAGCALKQAVALLYNLCWSEITVNFCCSL